MRIPRKPKKKVKINTTALPDIIFMLLFFFMVTTVIQNKKVKKLDLPEAINISQKKKAEPNELDIYLRVDETGDQFIVNELSGKFESFKGMISSQVNQMKEQGIFINKAILYIDANTSMSQVNKIKTELQGLNILNISYIHDLEHGS